MSSCCMGSSSYERPITNYDIWFSDLGTKSEVFDAVESLCFGDGTPSCKTCPLQDWNSIFPSHSSCFFSFLDWLSSPIISVKPASFDPCPFCGESPEIYSRMYSTLEERGVCHTEVECRNCGIYMENIIVGTESEALFQLAETWNHRVPTCSKDMETDRNNCNCKRALMGDE